MLVGRPSLHRSRKCLVRRIPIRGWYKGKISLEISQVRRIFVLAQIGHPDVQQRASGYLLFTMLLLTAHLGGAWSGWTVASSSFTLRLLGFTIAPLVMLASVYSRVR